MAAAELAFEAGEDNSEPQTAKTSPRLCPQVLYLHQTSADVRKFSFVERFNESDNWRLMLNAWAIFLCGKAFYCLMPLAQFSLTLSSISCQLRFGKSIPTTYEQTIFGVIMRNAILASFVLLVVSHAHAGSSAWGSFSGNTECSNTQELVKVSLKYSAECKAAVETLKINVNDYNVSSEVGSPSARDQASSDIESTMKAIFNLCDSEIGSDIGKNCLISK